MWERDIAFHLKREHFFIPVFEDLVALDTEQRKNCSAGGFRYVHNWMKQRGPLPSVWTDCPWISNVLDRLKSCDTARGKADQEQQKTD